MRHARLLMLFAVVMASPVTACADSGWWAWLEELSGPGPFGGPMYSHVMHCWTKDGKTTTCRGARTLNTTEPIFKTVRITGGFLSSYDFARQKVGYVPPPAGVPSSNNKPVYAVPIVGTLTVRTDRAWEFGTGAGGLFFLGTDVSSHARFIATPLTASWRFLVTNKENDTEKRQRWAIEGQTYLIVKGFNGTSFNAVNSAFKTPPVELKGVIGLSYTFKERR